MKTEQEISGTSAAIYKAMEPHWPGKKSLMMYIKLDSLGVIESLWLANPAKRRMQVVF